MIPQKEQCIICLVEELNAFNYCFKIKQNLILVFTFQKNVEVEVDSGVEISFLHSFVDDSVDGYFVLDWRIHCCSSKVVDHRMNFKGKEANTYGFLSLSQTPQNTHARSHARISFSLLHRQETHTDTHAHTLKLSLSLSLPLFFTDTHTNSILDS